MDKSKKYIFISKNHKICELAALELEEEATYANFCANISRKILSLTLNLNFEFGLRKNGEETKGK